MTEESPEPERGTTGWVYFAQVGEDGPIKIGWSTEPVRRVAEGQTWHWWRLRLLGISAGGPRHEAELHEELSLHRVVPTSREWYWADATVLAVIARCTEEGYEREEFNFHQAWNRNLAYPRPWPGVAETGSGKVETETDDGETGDG